MKNLFFLFFIFLFSYTSYSQTQFNVTYAQHPYQVGRNIFATDSCYYMIGARLIDNKGFVTAYKYDTLGNLLWDKSYGDTIYSWVDGVENNCIKTANGYALAGSCSLFDTETDSLYIRLYNFDENFDTIWTKTYLFDTIYNEPTNTSYCSDSGFAIAGWSQKDAETGEVLTKSKAFLLRTDSQGNYLWHKTYGTTDYADKFYKIVQTPDGGFLCGGSSKSYSNSHNYDWYIVKIDANGNEEWHRRYGSQSYNDSRVCGLFMTSDTSYVISGSFANNSGEQNPSIIVLNQNFQLTQIKSYPYTSSSSYIGQIKEIENGFVGIGGDRINNAEVKQTNLRKFDTDFNEVWRRKYTVGDTTNTDNYILSLDTCSDGGYVLGGWAGGFTGGQRLALIKTDEYGCDGTDWWPCSTDIMVNEYVHSEGFKMYPNPVAKGNNVQCVIINEQLSSLRGGTTKPSIEIYDLTGKLVYTSTPLYTSAPLSVTEGKRFDSSITLRLSSVTNSMSASITIDVSELESGIYLVKVGQQTKKLIVK